MAKLWQGRTDGIVDSIADDFNSSVAFDSRMVKEDIAGSAAHAAMLCACGVITESEAGAITAGLEGILRDLESGALLIDPTAEDIHMFVEEELTKRVGDPGKKLHTARSRNDQVALDIRLYLRSQTDDIRALVLALVRVLAKKAEEHAKTIMPGYTHLQRAQPITFGHHLCAYAFMLLRDADRLSDTRKRMNLSPLGSAALAGTTYAIDRQMTAEVLGFAGVVQNSLDGVADRDFCVELLSDIALIMTHLSRLSEELILWASWEFKFIELSDAYSTGSSIMPQKKNPDMAELIRGKTGRAFGDLMAMLTVLKGLPLAYNKDMQEDKEAVFDGVDTVKMCLSVMAPMIDTLTVKKENMRAAAAGGFINATDCADYLVNKGLPFREAYKITGELVRRCIAQGCTLETLPIAAYKAVSDRFDEDIYDAIRLETCVQRRVSEGGTSPDSVRTQIRIIMNILVNKLQRSSFKSDI